MRVHLLGTGSALTDHRRGNTSCAITHDERTLLIDCSGTPAQALLRAGLDPVALDAVLLTHRHPDHLYGLPALVFHLFLATRAQGRPPLVVYGPPETLAIAQESLAAMGILALADLFDLVFEPTPAAAGELPPLGSLRIVSFPVEHNQTATVGLRVEPAGEPARAVVCSADTALCDAVIEQSRGAALLVHECSVVDPGRALPGHTSLDQIDELAARTDVRKIVLVHLPPLTDVAEGRIRRALAARHGGRVILGEDGACFDL